MRMETLIQTVLLTFLELSVSTSTLLASEDVEPRSIPGWGVVTDPDGDCQLLAEDNKLKIAIPGKDHALATERGKTNAPRVLQELKGDFEVTVKVSVEFPHESESTVQTRRAFQGAGLVLWQDGGNYVRLEQAQLVVGGQTLKYASFELRRHGQFVKPSSANEHPLRDTVTWLKLKRTGSQVSAFVSEDGTLWRTLGALTIDPAEKLQVGVVAGHNTSTSITATFEDFAFRSVSDHDKNKVQGTECK